MKLTDLYVKLGLKSQDFNKGIDKAQQKTSGFANGLKKIGGLIAGAFAVSAIKNFISESVKLYDIQAKAEIQLLTALKGRRDIQQSLIQQAQDLQKVTLFGDEETIRAQALIAAFVKEEAQLKKIIPLVQDFATDKMMSLSGAADLVGKTLGSTTNAMSRYGIVVHGAVGSTERLDSLVLGLTDHFGGQAKAAALVGAGSITQMTNQWNDLKESIGKLVVESDTLISVLTDLTTLINALQGKKIDTKQFQEIGKIAATITGFLPIYNKFLDWYNKKNKKSKESKKYIDEESDAYRNQIKAEQDAIYEEKHHIKTIGELTTETKELKDSLSLYNVEQGAEIQSTLKQIEANEKLIKSLTTLQEAKGKTARVSNLSSIETISATGINQGDKKKKKTPLDDMSEFYDKNLDDADRFYHDYWDNFNNFIQDLSYLMEDFATDIIGQFGEAMGEMWKTGQFPSDFGSSILSGLGKFLGVLGKMLISFGVGSEAFQLLMANFMNPVGAVAAIAAGVALVAIGGAIQGYVRSGGRGGSSSGASSTSFNVITTDAQDKQLVAKVSGNQLAFVLEKHNNNMSLI